MAVCQRCNGRGQLQAGFDQSGRSVYSRCEACWGSGRVDEGNERSSSPQGCMPMLLAILGGAIAASGSAIYWLVS